MVRTEYAVLTTNELINFSSMRENRTSMEIELAQRLAIAMDALAKPWTRRASDYVEQSSAWQ